jgi:two-component system OmpR family sensor kinase
MKAGRLPIRWRIAAASTVATLVLLMGAGLIFITTLRSGLQGSLDNSLRSSVNELRAQVNPDGTLSADADGTLALADNTYGQVLTTGGAIIQSTSPALPRALVSTSRIRTISASPRYFNISVSNPGDDPDTQELRVLAVPALGGKTIIAVALNRDVVDEATERATKQLLVVGIVVLLTVAPGSWWLARSALKPVDRMRAQAAELQAQDAGGGLSVPVTNDEVGRLGSTLNELLARLHAALERERAFVADAGHELRTPLTVLRGELELAQRPGRTREDLLETVGIAAEETERLIRLAEDLLVLARDETSTTMAWTSFDLREVIGDSRDMIAAVAQRHDVTITVQGSEVLMVEGDPNRIRQAVDNVLSNAERFAPAGSTIIITASDADAVIRIEVLDEGPGFPPQLLPHVFERFRRGDKVRTRGTAERESAGAGLGLAIVRNILRSHGGDALAANRTERTGARVILQWPVSRVLDHTDEWHRVDE